MKIDYKTSGLKWFLLAYSSLNSKVSILQMKRLKTQRSWSAWELGGRIAPRSSTSRAAFHPHSPGVPMCSPTSFQRHLGTFALYGLPYPANSLWVWLGVGGEEGSFLEHTLNLKRSHQINHWKCNGFPMYYHISLCILKRAINITSVILEKTLRKLGITKKEVPVTILRRRWCE